MEGIVVNYLSSILQTNGPTDTSIVVDAILPVVSNVMNDALVQDFRLYEVSKALKQMHPKKKQDLMVFPLYFISIIGL